MSLVSHYHQKNWSALEEAWTDLMLNEGQDLDPVFDVLRMATERRQMSPCVPLVREHADLLGESDRSAEAAELLGAAMLGGGSPGELSKALWERSVAAWGEQSWWEDYTRIAGFRENATDMRAAWSAFRKLQALVPDTAIYHAKGWGIGVVYDLDQAQLEVKIRFATGRTDRFPLSSAIEIFEMLPPDDLRSLVVRDPGELQRRLKKEPLEVLASVLKRYRGKTTYPVLRNAMGQLGVDGPAFTSWWKRTRKEAESSSWFEVSGTGAKTQVRALLTEADPAETMRRQLRMQGNLKSALQRVRILLAGGAMADSLRNAALGTLKELAEAENGDLAHRLAVWMLLREERGETPEPLAELLRAAAAEPHPESPAQPQALWELFQTFPGAREQERCIELLAELFGEEQWRSVALENLAHAAPGMVRGLVDELLEVGESEALGRHYSFLLARQSLNPHLFIRLAELVEEGRVTGKFPAPVIRTQALIQLSTYLIDARINNPSIARARQRLGALLTTGKPPLLKRMLAEATKEELHSTLVLVGRGVEDSIESAFTDIVVEQAPELFRGDDRPFWDEPCIWTTRDGLQTRRRIFKDLVENKIPANSEAIGKAAAMGDLSENSEWESAVEEQRILTSRASEIEAELKSAELIENAALPDDVVCPGTLTVYREVSTGEEHAVRILGPWDTHADDVVSYLSPLARGLLGMTQGERASIELPSGVIEIEIVAVEPCLV